MDRTWSGDFGVAVQKGEQWSVKLLVDKLYPNKKAKSADINAALTQPIIHVVSYASLKGGS